MRNYHNKHYNMTVRVGVDEFTLIKHSKSEWVDLKRTTHGDFCGEVEFRSREALLMVKYMIESLLSEMN